MNDSGKKWLLWQAFKICIPAMIITSLPGLVFLACGIICAISTYVPLLDIYLIVFAVAIVVKMLFNLRKERGKNGRRKQNN